MMGRTHALTGALAFSGAALALRTGHPLTVGELAVGVTTCAGAAMLPDIDHPASEVSGSFGPFTRAFAHLVRAAADGHRNGTHSYLGAGLFSLTAFGAVAVHTSDPGLIGVGAAVAAGLAVCGRLAAIGDRDRPAAPAVRRWAAAIATAGCGAAFAAAAMLAGPVAGSIATGVLVALLLAAVIRVLKIPGWLDDLLPFPIAWFLVTQPLVDLSVVPFAVTLGVLVHIAGDQITKFGCPIGWPWSARRSGWSLIRTGRWIERAPVTIACCLALTGTLALHLAPAIPPLSQLTTEELVP